MKKKKRRAYWLEFKLRHHSNQYLMLSGYHLIRKYLNEGRIITRLEIVELTTEQYKHEFGI